MLKHKNIEDILKETVYLGRGIIIGKSKNNIAIAYFLTGRSENSQNRIFANEGDTLLTKPFDEKKVKDPTLIIYAPIRNIENKIIVTNGAQTDTIYEYIKNGSTFEEALYTHTFEPDPPIYTPRISAITVKENDNFSYKLSILKASDESGTKCYRYFFNYEATDNLGHFIHTYENVDNTPVAFEGEPKSVIIPDDIDSFASDIWNNLFEKNRISLFVEFIDIKTGKKEKRMFNRHLM